MFVTKKHLARRTFLKGAGAAVALPLLDAMVPAFASNVKQNPRIGFVYVPHGAVMARFTPDKVGRDFEFKDIMKPLEPYDMPAVRSIVRGAAANDYKFSAVVLGIANSTAFRMKVAQQPEATTTSAFVPAEAHE